MLPKEDRKAMLLRLYNDDSPLQDHSKDRFSKFAPMASDEINDAGVEADAADERGERITVIEAADEDNDDGLEEDRVAINTLAGDIVTKSEDHGSGAAVSNYGPSMDAHPVAESDLLS